MSEHPGFQVDTDLLHQAAGKAGETAAPIPDQTKAVLDSSHRTVAGLRGLRCGTALDACTGAWHQLLNDLHATMSRHGQHLETAARRYGGTDHRTAGGFVPTAAQQQNFVQHFG
ncbi:type VII secretion target [Kitasatospora sp. NPDC127059]|uniref:type VII secretion target n=1 Tax=unclassified Kitasatospora TaxID=2633591 RepID=UPI003666A842